MTVLSMFVGSILLIRSEAGTEEEGEDVEYMACCILYGAWGGVVVKALRY